MTASLWTIQSIWKFLAAFHLHMNAVKGESFVTLEWEILLLLLLPPRFICVLSQHSISVSAFTASQRLSSSGWWCWRVCIHPARAWGSSRPTQAQFWTGRGWEQEHCLWLRRECVHVPRVSYCRRHLCTHLVIYLCIDSINKHILWLARVVDSLRKALR